MNIDCSFTELIIQELEQSQSALLAMLERYDELRYLKAPKLYDEYAEKIGTYEDEVLRAELEAKLLERKLELIQTAINRREPIDMESIEAQIEQERQQKLGALESGVESGNITSFERGFLPETQENELKELYHAIVSEFHPQVNANLTETQKQLFQKALAAYQSMNLASLRLIYDMLMSSRTKGEVNRSDADDGEPVFAADYTLARQLISCFRTTEDDSVCIDKMIFCMKQCDDKKQEIESMLEQFPFTAEETLHDPEKTAAYLEELRIRGYRAKRESEELEKRIGELTGVSTNG